MIARKICWLLLVLSFLLMFFWLGSAAALALALSMLLIPIIALPLNLYISKRIACVIECGINTRKGKNSSAELIVENPCLLPAFRMSCVIEAENCLTGEKQNIELAAVLWPKGKKHLTFSVGDRFCGRIKLRLQCIKLYDLFSLVGVKRSVGMHRSITVLPDTFDQSLRMDMLSGSSDDSDSFSPHKPGWDVSEIFQIRDYVEGDSLRQIHWKLSGKMDRLVVRDPSLPVMRSLLLFWDRSNTALSNESMDAQAETVASLCRTLLDNSIVFTIGWNEPAEQRCVLNAVNSMEDVVAMMPRMLSLQGTETGLTGAALLMDALNGNRFSRIIYVSDSPDEAIEALRGQSEISMLIYGAGAPGAVCFDEENYREQLSELIL